jgi:prevent-host-death family protein
MKTISVAQARSNIEAVLKSAQREKVVLTRSGRPSAVIVGVESFDAEDVALASSPEFWRMIEERRKGRSIPLTVVKRRLEARERKETVKLANGRRKGAGKSARSKA